ncbi:MAG: efflux RND transporter periplasmic adaptor subunit [Victivallaceae bacterium]|nr:efflux RND transporter periplasmic adaptor subunit [Victivallaceae bacterium]
MNNFLCRLAPVSLAVALYPALLAGAPKAGPAPEYVVTAQAQLIPETVPHKYIGHIEALNEVDLRARVAGNITAFNFTEGDFVKAGELLFTIEDTSYSAKVKAAKATCEQYEAALKYDYADFERQKSLVGTNAVAKSVYEQAESTWRVTTAKLEYAKACLIELEDDLNHTKIYAPISGRIGRATYSCGNYVQLTSDKLATIVQQDPIQVSFAISENDYYKLFGNFDDVKKNATVSIELGDGSVYPVQGHVAMIDNKVNSTTGTLRIWANFANPECRLIPGGLVKVELANTASRKLPAVKLSAVLTDGKNNYVYVLDDKNTVSRRNVELGGVAGSYQIITSGIKDGETVIVDGTHKARPGATVIPVPEEK